MIEKNFINSFRAGIELAYQQTNSVLSPYVEHETQEGEFDSYDRIGLADDMKEDNTRYGTNPMSEIQHDRRWIMTRYYDNGKPIEPKDLDKVATDPTHAYTQSFIASAMRKKDDIIVSTFEAPAVTGKKYGDASVNMVGTTAGKITVGSVSNTSGYIVADTRYAVTAGLYEGIDIAEDYLGTGVTGTKTGLTIAKLKAIRHAMLGTLAVNQDTLINLFVTRNQLDNLLGINEVINGDFAVRKALAEGSVTTFMGFRFIQSERLVKTGTSRACYAFLPKAVKIATRRELKADIWNLTEHKNIPYLYFAMGLGGTRMWGEAIARVQCTE